MKVNGETEITLWQKTIPAIADEISNTLSGPICPGTTLLLSNDEEIALDKIFGMAWSVAISEAVGRACSASNATRSFRCNIEFPDDEHVLATYL
jgi:hypothetical protein